MLSKRKAGFITLLSLTLLSSASCGLLGQKEDLNRLLNFNPEAMGCMNDAGNNVKSYFRGEIEQKKWEGTWDCATNSLTLFKKFVRSTDPAGYTREDIHALISQFLVTNTHVTPELVAAVFELKASLFGGSKLILSGAELEKVIEFINAAKVESTTLLPVMATQAREASPDNLLKLVDALSIAGENIGRALKTQGNPMFSWGSAQALSNELSKMLNLDLPPDAVVWLSAVKVLLMAGTREGIEADAWPRVFRTAVSYGGPAIAAFSVDEKYLKGPNAKGEFCMMLAWRIKTSLMQTLDMYGGALPLSALDQLIDALPEKWLTIDRAAIKKTLRPLALTVLHSRVPDAIDQSAIDLIFAKLDFWSRGQTHLEKIYLRLNADESGVAMARFVEEAEKYAQEVGPAQRADVNRLIVLARNTLPLFHGNDNQITFSPTQSHSLHNLSTFHWIRIAAEHLLAAYASEPGGMRGTVDDLKRIIDDYIDIGRAFNVMDPSVPDLHIKRFREANLFTYASNGDQYMDADEATYYVALLFSAAQISNRIQIGTDAACPSQGKDILGQNWKDADCFRNEYFGNYKYYWDHLPLLIRHYEGLSDARRIDFQKALEIAARRYGYSSQRIARVDTDGFAGIVQYIEVLFSRYDTNESQVLTLSELMNAYPVFKGSLAELGKLNPKDDFLLTAVFTYTVKYGHPPTQDFWGIVSLVGWIATKPLWKLNATRLSLFKVIAAISVPEPLPEVVLPPIPTVPPRVSINQSFEGWYPYEAVYWPEFAPKELSTLSREFAEETD